MTHTVCCRVLICRASAECPSSAIAGWSGFPVPEAVPISHPTSAASPAPWTKATRLEEEGPGTIARGTSVASLIAFQQSPIRRDLPAVALRTAWPGKVRQSCVLPAVPEEEVQTVGLQHNRARKDLPVSSGGTRGGGTVTLQYLRHHPGRVSQSVTPADLRKR